jgi:hypothetical protein
MNNKIKSFKLLFFSFPWSSQFSVLASTSRVHRVLVKGSFGFDKASKLIKN